MIMQESPCVVCASSEAIPIYTMRRDPYLHRLGLEGTRVTKVMCRVCGLIYSRPQLEASELKRLYDMLRVGSTPSEEHLWWKQRQAEEDFQWVTPYLPAKGAVLDIGCSEGSFLMQFQRLGWVTCGVEPSAFAQFGRQVYGLDIRQGTFEEVDLPLRTFDIVTALRILEHVADPRSFLTRVKVLLKPGGWLYLEVPNVWRPRHHPTEFLGAQHLRLFTRSSLLALLGQLGFVPVAMDDQGRGLRVLAQPAMEDETPVVAFEPLNHAFAQAMALHYVLLSYRMTHFWTSTMKSKVRHSLDRLLGPEQARAIVAWSKRVRRDNPQPPPEFCP